MKIFLINIFYILLLFIQNTVQLIISFQVMFLPKIYYIYIPSIFLLLFNYTLIFFSIINIFF